MDFCGQIYQNILPAFSDWNPVKTDGEEARGGIKGGKDGEKSQWGGGGERGGRQCETTLI